MTMDLFSPAQDATNTLVVDAESAVQEIPLVDGELTLYRNGFSAQEADEYFTQLQDTLAWTQEKNHHVR